jgi:hypothetical protein
MQIINYQDQISQQTWYNCKLKSWVGYISTYSYSSTLGYNSNHTTMLFSRVIIQQCFSKDNQCLIIPTMKSHDSTFSVTDKQSLLSWIPVSLFFSKLLSRFLKGFSQFHRIGGFMLIPDRPGTPPYKLQDKKSSRACNHARCHVLSCSGPYLPVEASSGAATCAAAPNLASLPRRALVLPHVSRLWTSPPCRGGI